MFGRKRLFSFRELPKNLSSNEYSEEKPHKEEVNVVKEPVAATALT